MLHGTSCGCRIGLKSASIGQCSSGIFHCGMIVLDWRISLSMRYLLNQCTSWYHFLYVENRLKKKRLTYIRDSTYNRELKRKLQQVLFGGAMRRPCAPNHGSRITTKTTSMKIAVRQMMLGRQAAGMCVSVDTSLRTVYIMSTSIPVHLIG